MGYTALAILSLLGDGQVPGSEAKHALVVERAVDWLSKQLTEDGCLGDAQDGRALVNHALGTLALGETVVMTQNGSLDAVRGRALEFLVKARTEDGAFSFGGHTWEGGDPLVTLCSLMAFESARSTSTDERRQTMFDEALAWFGQRTDAATGVTGRDAPGVPATSPIGGVTSYEHANSQAATASAFLAERFAGNGETELSNRRLDVLTQNTPRWSKTGETNDFLYWYVGTLSAFQGGPKSWNAWRPSLLETLGPSRPTTLGTSPWPTVGPWAEDGGPLFTTAMGAMTLQVYRRFERLR